MLSLQGLVSWPNHQRVLICHNNNDYDRHGNAWGGVRRDHDDQWKLRPSSQHHSTCNNSSVDKPRQPTQHRLGLVFCQTVIPYTWSKLLALTTRLQRGSGTYASAYSISTCTHTQPTLYCGRVCCCMRFPSCLLLCTAHIVCTPQCSSSWASTCTSHTGSIA